MREIKFRAWEKRAQKMEYTSILNQITCFYAYQDINERIKYAQLEGNDYVLMQYTGLKDKNGKEIYEGDVISSGTSYPLEVFWMGLAWGVRWKCDGDMDEGIICDDDGDMSISQDNQLLYMEIIGNIYENPELVSK